MTARGAAVFYLALSGETWPAIVRAIAADGTAVLAVGSFELELSRIPLDDTRTIPGSWSPSRTRRKHEAAGDEGHDVAARAHQAVPEQSPDAPA